MRRRHHIKKDYCGYGAIYKITNTCNNKVYVGQTIRAVLKRFERHLKSINNQDIDTLICRAIRKYGIDAFKYEIIDIASNQDELNNKEIHWIAFFDSTNKAKGYNMTIGGDGGNTYCNRSKKKMRKTRSLISKALSGRGNGLSLQIKAKNIKTNEEYVFDSLTKCLEFLGVKNKRIVTDRANGKKRTYWHDVWMFAYEDNEYGKYFKA